MASRAEQAAARELVLELARRDLCVFATRVPVPGSPLTEIDDAARIPIIETQQAAHHRLILTEMQRCMGTRHGRLMVMAPPGSAKSTYASVVAPAAVKSERRVRWVMADRPSTGMVTVRECRGI